MEQHESPDLEALFERFRTRGDVAALALVFDAAAPELFAVARWIARKKGEPEDLVQQTFLTAIERRASFDATKNVLPWLLGILAMHARKARDRDARGGRVSNDVELADSASGPEESARDSELALAVERAVSSLPETYARVVGLHLSLDLAPREIAARLSLEPGTVRVQLHRGLKLLRESLPPGFAGAIAVSGDGAGLAAVRTSVLKSATASLAPIGVATLSWTSPLFLSIAAVLIAVIGAAAWKLGLSPRASSNTSVAVAHDALEPLPAPVSARAASTELAITSSAEPASAARQTVPPPAKVIGVTYFDERRLHGRLLTPEGKPAVGASVKLTGRPSNSMVVEKYGSPKDWKDPDEVLTDADGRFSVKVTPPRAFQFFLDARRDGCARLSWRWGELANADYDLGETRFDPACTLIARVVDEKGAVLERDYVLSARPALSLGGDRENIIVNSTLDAKTHEYRLEGLPPGRARISGQSKLGNSLPETLVDMQAAAMARLDLVDKSPNPDTQITIKVWTDALGTSAPDPAHFWLRREGAEPRHPVPTPRRVMQYTFDGLEPGEYALEIDDPHYTGWTMPHAKTGELYKVKLVGSAGFKLKVQDGSTHEAITDYRLKIEYLDSHSTPNTFVLRDTDQPIPEGSVYAGVIPGNVALYVQLSNSDTQRFEVAALKPGETRELSLEVGAMHAIRGRVVSSDAPKGTALAIPVQITRGKVAGSPIGHGVMHTGSGVIPEADREMKTDAAGTFAFDRLGKGTYMVRAVWSPWLVTDREVQLDAADAVDIELVEPEHGYLEGRLVLPDAMVNDGLSLELDSAGTGHALSLLHRVQSNPMAEPDSIPPDGKFRFGPLPVGRLTAHLHIGVPVEDGWMRISPDDPFEFDIAAGKTTTLERDLRTTLRGRVRVLVRVDGRAVSSGMVNAGSPVGTGFDASFGSSVNAEGKSIVAGLKPGPVRVQFNAGDGAWGWIDPVVRDMKAGQELKLEYDIQLVKRSVRFLDARTDAVLAKSLVRWRTGFPGKDTSIERGATTDEAGRATIELPIGPVAFLLGGKPTETKVDWTRAPEGELVVRLETRD
jgi:RNA polymerase sigma factor (sigma-70 family)